MRPSQQSPGWTVLLDKMVHLVRAIIANGREKKKMRIDFPPTCKALLRFSWLEKGEESRKFASQNKHKIKIDIKMSREKDLDTDPSSLFPLPPAPLNLHMESHTCSTCFLLTHTWPSFRDNDLSFALKDSVHQHRSHQGVSPQPIVT